MDMNTLNHDHGVVCSFCWGGHEIEDIAGKLYIHYDKSTPKISAHHKCMQFASNLTQYKFDSFGGFVIDDVEKEIFRGSKLKCFICKGEKGESRRVTGACCGCAVKSCCKTFHFPCAYKDPKTIIERDTVRENQESYLLHRVFCSSSHKETFHAGIKEDVEMLTKEHKENEKLDGASGGGDEGVTDDDDYGSPRYSSKVTSDHDRVKIQFKRTSDSYRDMKQNGGEIKATCAGPSVAWSDENLIKFGSAETNCESNSDIQHTAVNMLPSPSRRTEATKDDAGEIALLETSSNLQGRKRQSQTQLTSQRNKKKNRSRIKSSRKEKEKSMSSAIEVKYKSTNSDNSDMNIETESSSDSTSDSFANRSLSKYKDTMKTCFLDNTKLVSQDLEETHQKQTKVFHQSLAESEDDSQNLDQSAGSSEHRMQTSSEHQGEGSDHDVFQKPEDVRRDCVHIDSCPTHDECLMILVANTKDFEPKAEEVCQGIADQWKIDITQVYIWSKVRPVAVEGKLILNFIACISEAVSCGRSKELRLLLLDSETMQNKCEELQGRRKISRNSGIQTPPSTAAVKEVTAHSVSCIVLELNRVTDPLHLIRDYLKKPHLFPLQKDMPFSIKSQRLHKNVLKEELSILKEWFSNFLKPLCLVLHHPSDDILYLPGAETDELYAVFQSEIEQLITDDVTMTSSPVVVFAGNLNYDIVIFERYLEALGNKVLEDYSPHPVICIFPVSNLKSLSFSLLKSPVDCWSAFDPQIKPINYIVAAWD